MCHTNNNPNIWNLELTIEELKQIDIKTRNFLTMSGNFHRNGDIDKLYVPRKLGGRGLRSLITAFECRIISIKYHLKQNKKRNKYLYEVVQHEEENVIRVAEELLMRANLNMVDQTEHRQASQEYLKYSNEQRLKCYKSKPMHAYIQNKIENEEQIDKNITKSWTADKYITSHFEGYAFAIHEQEITTKDLTYRRDRKAGKIPLVSNKCRLCKVCVEDITHITSGCSKMSSRYYLPLRHDVIAKTIFKSLIKKDNPNNKITFCNDPEFVHNEGNNLIGGTCLSKHLPKYNIIDPIYLYGITLKKNAS